MVTTDPAFFRAIPWCADLLSDPDYTVVPSRFGKPNAGRQGELFTRTLATDDTVSACVYQIRNSQHNDSTDSVSEALPHMVPEVRTFIFTGPGLNGWPGIAHGGFVSSIIDEVMGFLINSNTRATEAAGNPSDGGSGVPKKAPASTVMTAELTTRYRRPVPTGEALLIRAWADKIEGRKIIVKATLEDSERQVLSEGIGLFIALKPGAKSPEIKKKGAKL